MGEVRSQLHALGGLIMDKAAGAAGKVGRRVLGMPLHVVLPVGVAIGVAVVVLAATRRPRSLKPHTPASIGSAG